MKTPVRFSVVSLLVCLMSYTVVADELQGADPTDVGLSSERLARFSAAMEQGIEAGHFPGAVAVVARNGKVAFFESYGLRDKETGLSMENDAIFRIASMTKAITGVAVMILYEEGRFALNDPVSNYIPAFKNSRVQVGGAPRPDAFSKSKDDEFDKDDEKNWTQADLDQWLKENWQTLSDEEKQKWTEYYATNGKARGKGKGDQAQSGEAAETVPANRPITIRDLLRHTAGISYAMGNIWEEGDDLGQMIDKLADQPLKSHPGTRFEYGLSTDVLARLVEVVSGQAFDEFVSERILIPLDMKDTGFYVPEENATRLVKMPSDGVDDKKADKSYSEDLYLSPPVILMGGTGMVSTAMDYLRFCQMLLNNGELDGERVLGRKAVELMHANHMNDVEERAVGKGDTGVFKFGLTFGIKDSPGNRGVLGSKGTYYWGGAYGTSFWIDPAENLVGVFMVNGLTDVDEQSYQMPYSQMLEHFTYQAIVD